MTTQNRVLFALKRIQEEELNRSVIVTRPFDGGITYELQLTGNDIVDTIELSKWDYSDIMFAFESIYSDEYVEKLDGYDVSMVKMDSLDIAIHNIENPDDFKIW
jgi:hypothetical protein